MGWSKMSGERFEGKEAASAIEASISKFFSTSRTGCNGDDFVGDLEGELALGDSSTTLVGVALTRNVPRGDSATFFGVKAMGGRFVGDVAGASSLTGDSVTIGIAIFFNGDDFCGEASIGAKEMRLLRRRVDLLRICLSSARPVASTGSSSVEDRGSVTSTDAVV
jgi:hypothetical protein